MSLNVVGEMEDTADNDIKQSTEQTSLDERRNTEIAEMEKPIKSPILSSAAPIVGKNVIDEVSKQFHEKSNLDTEVNSATTSSMQEETIPDGIDQTAKGLNQGDNITIEKTRSRTNQNSMAEEGPDDIIVLGSERYKMSRTPETVVKTSSSSATKVDDVAIEMDSLGGGDGKEVTARSIAMKSTLASDRVTSAEIADDHISGDQEAGEPEDEPRCTVIFWACCVAFGVLMVDIIFNLLLPSIDVITDWMFFIGNIVSLHFGQNLPISEMKMSQELFILACQRKQNLECFSGECSFKRKWGGIAPIYNDKCHLVNPVCENTGTFINETLHYGYFPYEEQDCDYFSSLVYFTAVPLILNTAFTIYYWRRDIKAHKTSWWTLPLAVLGLYPQYKCLKYIIQRDAVAKEEYLGGLGLLEAWLESAAQVLITSAIMLMPYASPLSLLSSYDYYGYLSHRSANSYEFNSPQFYKSIGFSYFTWVSSIIAMNIGLTKFVCNSPMKANKNVLFTFLLHTSFVIRVTAIMAFMTPRNFNIETYWQIPLVFALGAVPFTVNLFNLLCRAGTTKTLALFKLYPQIFISPIFSPFMYTYKSKPKTEQVSKHAEDISLPLTSNIPSSSSDTGDKTGFCIWKWPSFINLIYLSFIPGGIPIGDDGSINYFSVIFFLPVAVILLICGVAYFFGSNRCKRIARFEPNVFNPSD